MVAIDLINARSQLAAGFVAPRSGDVAVAAAGLERMRRLVDALGNPQRAFKTIHVAGSKGKGSTVAYAAGILTATGRRTGRYISPHLVDWRERISVDGVDVSRADFDRLLHQIDTVMARLEEERPGDPPHNAFELLTAAAFVHFQEVGCEVAVIEVGIGGRFDSTNVIDSDVAVVTRIESEHVEMLGPTLSDVAWNKAGILRPGRPGVTVAQRAPVLETLQREADAVDAVLSLQGRDWSVSGSAASFSVEAVGGALVDLAIANPMTAQRDNAAAAVVATGFLATPTRGEIQAGLHAGTLPGRFEVVEGVPSVVLDVAHTAESIAALGQGIKVTFPGRRVVVLLGVLADKGMETIGQAASGWTDAAVTTTAPSPRGRSSADVASALRAHIAAVHDVADPVAAWSVARDLAGDSGVVVVTGSFAIVGHIRRNVLDRE